jgi:nitrite reductase/ring-hydroxylating ferredoxin subunit
MLEVCDAEDVQEGEIKAFRQGDVALCVARTDGRLRAFQESCTHRQCSLVDGEVEDDAVYCPCHGAGFDLETGDVMIGPAVEPLPVYETHIVEGRVWVDVPVADIDTSEACG